MKIAEAKSLALRLKGLLPRTTDEQMIDWASRFIRFDHHFARECVDRYVEKNAELRTSGLLELLRAGTYREVDRRAADREYEAQAEAEWAVIDAQIAKMDDAELAEQKRRALERIPEQSRFILGRSDPRTSRAMKALIAGSLRATTATWPA